MAANPAAEYMEDVEGSMPPGINSVPVYVTNPIPTEERPTSSYTVGQYAPPVEGSGLPVALAGFMATRSRLVIRNLGTATVWIAPDPSACTHTSAWPILAGSEFRMYTSEAVYAATDVSSTAGPSLVATLAEYTSGS